MMRFGSAAFFVAMLTSTTAHQSKQKTVGSETYRQDKDDSAINLDNLQISNLGKRYLDPFAMPAYSKLSGEDLTSDLQLTQTIDGFENALSVATRLDDEPCPEGSVSRNRQRSCLGNTKPMIP